MTSWIHSNFIWPLENCKIVLTGGDFMKEIIKDNWQNPLLPGNSHSPNTEPSERYGNVERERTSLFHHVEFIPTCQYLSKNVWARLNLSAKSQSCKDLLEQFSSDVVAVYSIVNVCKYLNDLQNIQTKVRWRFCKILWPPHDIWTLTWQEKGIGKKIFFFLFNFEITGCS